MIEQGNKYFRWRQPTYLASGRSTDSKPMWIWVLLTKLPPFNWTYAKGKVPQLQVILRPARCLTKVFLPFSEIDTPCELSS